MKTSLPVTQRSEPKAAPASHTEYAWIAMVAGATLGAVVGHLLWRKALFGAVFAGTIGYLVGALIDRARRK